MPNPAAELVAKLPNPIRSRLRGLVRGAPSLEENTRREHDWTDTNSATQEASSPTDDRLTESDIHAAYRLFHGRPADPEGLKFFSNHIGSWSVRDVLPYFAHSDEFRQSETFRLLLGGVAGEGLTVVERGDHKLLVPDGDAAVGEVLKKSGTYEPHVLAALDQYLKPGHTVIDCGANIGVISFYAAAIVGSTGRVVAVEALSDNARLLRISAALNGFDHVEVHNAAVGDRPGSLVIDTAAGSNGIVGGRLDELIHTSDPAVLAVRTVCPTLTLDSLADSLDRVDLIKLDVEGAEGLAVAGGMKLLERDLPVVLLEYSPALLSRVSSIEGADLLKWFGTMSYTITIVDSDLGPEVETRDVGVHGPDTALARSGRDHLDLCLIARRG
ncbi:MAG: FkbM family methyltransferase [Actinobacteria bacterium]|nr:FkbM family methyltransferase [Actinomycetota bacterium]